MEPGNEPEALRLLFHVATGFCTRVHLSQRLIGVRHRQSFSAILSLSLSLFLFLSFLFFIFAVHAMHRLNLTGGQCVIGRQFTRDRRMDGRVRARAL